MNEPFRWTARDWTPAYLRLSLGELERRAEAAVEMLRECRLCPRNCGVDRLANRAASCRIGRRALVASHFAHFGEEDCLRGTRGSGTIFFTLCNLRCVFCQNHDISQLRAGSVVSPDRLASFMLELQGLGCHNINLVTPEHVVPQILEALPIAVKRGLRLPIVYNTSAYDSHASLELMDGIVDIYMPDFKMWSREHSHRYLKAPDYAEAARAAIVEMQRQVGDLTFDEQGLAKRGLLVRHLVMPEGVADTREIMRFLVREVSPHVYVNIMDQYHPDARVYHDRYSEINRPVYEQEYREALRTAEQEGVYRFDYRRSFRRRRWY